jgi:hypothetical protein
MGEKWFQFVSRIKKQLNLGSLKEAMAAASKRKSEWKKGPSSGSDMKMTKGRSKKSKKAKKTRKSRRSRKMKGGSGDDSSAGDDKKM